ncbi:hypothetical protein LUZ63_000907 [Rhynchospora breviuscula]|uniref:Uncharacterized protein n=1 Tax=Rhynchospora breviuscula TaxID=2022672 RepID=A0A9Q0HXD3_9POAL|nr:hypothetical protein LUZ63_000907 [Rhynchospora breviuscula]
MWAAAETPQGSGNFSKDKVTFTCSKTSPVPCDYTGKSTLPSLGYIFSFGQDNNKDLFYMTSKGVYRVVRPSLCGYTCPIETVSPPPPASQPSSSLQLKRPSLLFLGQCFRL